MGKRKFEIGDIVNINDKAPKYLRKDLQNRSKTQALFVVTNYNGWPGEYSVSIVSAELAQEISTEFQKVKVIDRKNKLHQILKNHNKHMNQYESDSYKVATTGLTLNRNLKRINAHISRCMSISQYFEIKKS